MGDEHEPVKQFYFLGGRTEETDIIRWKSRTVTHHSTEIFIFIPSIFVTDFAPRRLHRDPAPIASHAEDIKNTQSLQDAAWPK